MGMGGSEDMKASGRQHPKMIRIASRLALVAAAVATCSTACPNAARADVVADIEEARERCDALYGEAEQANEELNGTQVRLDEVNERIGKIEEGIQADKVLLREGMRAQYKSGATSGWDAVMRSESLSQMIDAEEYAQKMQESNRANIQSVMQATRELRAARDEMVALRDEQAARKEELDRKVGEANDYMAGLTQELREQLGVDSQSPSWDIPAEISSGTGEAWRDVVLTVAYANLGGTYVYGGSSLKAADCSGLTMLCYAKAGISISHYSESQGAFCTKPMSQALPGDIAYRPGHVGIVVSAPHDGQPGVTIEAHTPARGISYGSTASFTSCGSPI